MICHVCACTGWTWDYVWECVDIPRLRALNAYWKKYPPLHVMVGHFLGAIKPEPPKTTNADVAQLQASFPAFELGKF